MTLAAIFLLSTSGMATVALSPASARNPANTVHAPAFTQAAAAPSQPPASGNPQASAAGQNSTGTKQSIKSPAKKPHHKKPAASDCVSAPTGADASTPSTAGPGKPATSGNTKQETATTQKDCPPTKIIVRQGGTAEPTIQLAGGPGGDQAVQQRNAVNQMLGSTDANLKKIEGHTLAASEQDTVNQIHQFSDQSRAALDAGDLERARTLAWKAETLSEDLANPKK